MFRLRLLALLLPLLAAACSGGERDRTPPSRATQLPSGSRPVTVIRPTDAETKACFADLAREEVRFSPLPDRDYGAGCTVFGSVQLIDIGLPVTQLGAMRCRLAEKFIGWARHGVAPAARIILGSELVRVESMGSYSCRNVVGGSGPPRLSEHAQANAVDVAGFVLADGRRITVQNDWKSQDPTVQQFLRVIHASACKRFGTVLSPDYNAAHHDHLHLDMGRGPFCR